VSRRPCALSQLREPEVEHLDDTIGRDLDVRRFQVSVDDARFICRLECFRDLLRNRQGFALETNRIAGAGLDVLRPNRCPRITAAPAAERRADASCCGNHA
jgi:hypothetical protein